MPSTGGFSAGLASLSDWLMADCSHPAFEPLFGEWSRASGYRASGLVWPAVPPHIFARTTTASGTVETPVTVPTELSQVRAILADGPTTVWPMPHSAGRLYTLVTPPGRPAGLLWTERAGSWTEADRNYLALSARLIERSPAVAGSFGPAIDPERLQQRLADAAVIAGRMAHEFNNILTGINGFADLTVPLVPPGSQAAKFVGEIAAAGRRGMEFTQQLHQLGRSGGAKPTPVAVGAVLAKEITRLDRPAAEVRVVNAVPASLPLVAMDPGPLAAVLGHLLANAVEAVPAGGPVTVSGRSIELSAAAARSYLGRASAGPHVEVTVADAGPGVTPAALARLFVDPFLTTKVRHRGLGLAVVFRTLSAHRGGVRLDPVAGPGTGTAARIVIPLAAVRPVAVSSPVSVTPVFASTPRTGA